MLDDIIEESVHLTFLVGMWVEESWEIGGLFLQVMLLLFVEVELRGGILIVGTGA